MLKRRIQPFLVVAILSLAACEGAGGLTSTPQSAGTSPPSSVASPTAVQAPTSTTSPALSPTGPIPVERLTFEADENIPPDVPGSFEPLPLPIRIINSDGTDLELPEMFGQFANSAGGHFAWSPDGSLIAFDGATFRRFASDGDRGTDYGIWVGDPGRGTVVPIIPEDGLYTFGALGGPSWAPDSRQLVFAYSLNVSESKGNRYRLLVVDAISSAQRQLTDGEHLDLQPAWSPDGDWIAFLRFEEGISRGECGSSPSDLLGCVHADLYLVRPDGSDLTRLLPDVYLYAPTTRWDGIYFAPQWSPDGTQLLVLLGDDQPDLAIVDVSSGSAQTLAPDPGRDYHPTWSPDSARIAFVSERSGDADIYVLELGDGSLVRLTESPGLDTVPVWSPSGRQIAFLSGRQIIAGTKLFLMNSEGSNERQLVEDYVLFRPAWIPRGP